MGTYTTNYDLYMPTIGEQGWGELINGNYQTIDTTMAGLNTRIGTLETETDAFDSRIEACEESLNNINVGCVTRVGVFTSEQPHLWTVGSPYSKSISFTHRDSTHTGTIAYTPDDYFFNGWDDFDNFSEEIVYTVKYTCQNATYYSTSVTITFTNYFTSESYTETTTLGSTNKTFTMNGYPFQTIYVDAVLSKVNSQNGGEGSIFNFTRPTLYIKPKGT